MKNTIGRKQQINVSLNTRAFIFDCISFAFVLLFMYTASSKILTFSVFTETLAKLPLIGGCAGFLAYAIPGVEILISLLLIIPLTKRLGMIAALLLMSLFTLFLVYMVATVTYLPCSCGGVIARLSWEQHILFNTAFVIAAIVGLSIYRR